MCLRRGSTNANYYYLNLKLAPLQRQCLASGLTLYLFWSSVMAALNFSQYAA